jgi:hypothetical protein
MTKNQRFGLKDPRYGPSRPPMPSPHSERQRQRQRIREATPRQPVDKSALWLLLLALNFETMRHFLKGD